VEARDAGWAEAVLRVDDPAALTSFANRVAGWRVTGPIDGEWWISDAAGDAGAIRLVPAPPGSRLAPDHVPWDTGGLFSLMTRSNDSMAAYRAALELGWTAINAPVSLEFGGVTLVNVVLRGPDGVNVAIYERLAPRMPDEADLRKLRRPFNSMQVVRDLRAARAFYVDLLGFAVLAEGSYPVPTGAASNFFLPEALAGRVAMEYLIVAPKTDGPTRIEIVRFAGLEGKPRPGITADSRGLVALRFPVSSLDTIRSRLEASGRTDWEILDLRMPPFGTSRALRIRSPEGATLEFFELPKAAAPEGTAPR
jgi:catechol 2,3-dioxygenase-like lactoylglutathione lyase family enzyme